MRNLYLTSPMMSGPDVSATQQRLDDLGWGPGPADGLYGPVTVDAVCRLQRAASSVSTTHAWDPPAPWWTTASWGR